LRFNRLIEIQQPEFYFSDEFSKEFNERMRKISKKISDRIACPSEEE
jgi:hypothetical protein